ncbi:MAG: tetratricopeptide repeat protein [Rhodanobacteraceae bacterium]|nr:MAG: tetratricopeptide repeat protein [Rhodanobacteraceae bacterium]
MTGGLQELDADSRARFERAAQALAAGNLRESDALSRGLLERHPGQSDVLHLVAGVRARLGNHAGALQAIRRALATRPDDAAFLCTFAGQLAAVGQLDDALATLRRACGLQPGLAMAWYNLGVLSVRAMRFDEADAALRRAIELAPDHLQARLQRADLAKMSGRDDDARAAYRAVLGKHPACGDAWWGLSDIRQAGLGEDDIPAMQAAMRARDASERDRIALGFSIARLLDRSNRCAEAMAVLKETHAHAQRLQPWDTAMFARGVDAILAAFPPAEDAASPAELGKGVIFIASLPRSGSTLAEQMLASHSRVEGAGELQDLPQVLLEESTRRGQHYPAWVASMSPEDWRRLGERYLARTARWRRQKTFHVDKLPGNWLHVGAIRAMLPGAKVVVCRRDPLETCFSCWRQYMTAAGQGWTHRFEDLAAYWNGFDRAVRHWQQALPGFVHVQQYEHVIADPAVTLRALLDYCGLPFEQACLEFHRNPREVRSPSAMQVREPLKRDTARASRYGALLDPLRAALGFVDIMSAH